MMIGVALRRTGREVLPKTQWYKIKDRLCIAVLAMVIGCS